MFEIVRQGARPLHRFGRLESNGSTDLDSVRRPERAQAADPLMDSHAAFRLCVKPTLRSAAQCPECLPILAMDLRLIGLRVVEVALTLWERERGLLEAFLDGATRCRLHARRMLSAEMA